MSFKFKISSRIKQHDLRHFRYVFDSIFDEASFNKTLQDNGIRPSDWMINIDIDNQDLSDIITRPEYQYS